MINADLLAVAEEDRKELNRHAVLAESKKTVVKLDEERKAAMVSNLLVVLCGDNDTQPVINTGTLYA